MSPWLQRLVPQHLLSRFAGFLANCEVIWLKNSLIRYFLSRYAVNLNEAQEPNPFVYANFNAFFTRVLKPTVRPISSGIHDLISPADGSISQFGKIEGGRILQAKGHHFSVEELLGGTSHRTPSFKEGSFLTVYLAPKDYHRVHMPVDGQLSHMMYVPGKLFSVNSNTAASTPNLFARNERVIAFFNTSIGRVAIVLVGAMIVGSIETVWSGTVNLPRRTSIQSWDYHNPIFLKRGEEMGRFKLGSTVIILFEEGMIDLHPFLTENQNVLMGECIGTLKPNRW